jgi:hypothetical protein
MAAGLGFLIALLSLGRTGSAQPAVHRRPGAPAPAHTVLPTTIPVDTSERPPPPPWPQVVPPGLPPFPGKGWVPDTPLSAGVAVRAKQLRPELWGHGAGTQKIEQVRGRWIAFLAVPHRGKHGVEAYHLASEAPVQPVPAVTTITPTTPATPVAVPVPVPVAVPAAAPAAVSPQRAELAKRLAANLAGKAKGKEDKTLVQEYQGLAGLTKDGMYGPNVAHSLAADGIVPPSPLYWPRKWNDANTAIKDWKAYATQQAALETDNTRRLAWEESARGARMQPVTPYTATHIQQAAAQFFRM